MRKHYRDLALADRDNDDFLVELEMNYLFGDDDDEDEDAEIDVGQNDEQVDCVICHSGNKIKHIFATLDNLTRRGWGNND